jgi:1,4-dihydroxy-2-naphthoyl-CoA hydrolase
MIWFIQPNLDELNNRPKNHIGALLDIKFTEIGDNYLKGTMPVDDRTRQPYGILHGGASVVLAETLGSVASNMVLDTNFKMGVGLEVNANHLRPVKSGLVTGICTPIHIGGKTHVWDIKLYNDKGKITCISRLTISIVPVIKL